jgi:AcrR family transcriptional regulator
MDKDVRGREPDTERRILEAAAKVFMMKGKLGSSMQDIADEAGINRTLLHYYFRNKDKLFDTVFDKLLQQVFPSVVGILVSNRPFMERIELMIEAYATLLRENPYLPVFIIQEISLNPERLAGTIKDRGINPEQALGVFSAELEKSGMKGMNPRHFFASIMGMVLFPYIGRPLFQALAFQGDSNAYDAFLEERMRHVPEMVRLAFLGARTESQET